MGENFREFDKAEHFRVLLKPTRSPSPRTLKFADKTFVEAGNTVNFTNVFTRESFWLYGIRSAAVQATYSLKQATGHK